MAEIGDNVDRWQDTTDQNRASHMGEMDFRRRTIAATAKMYPTDPGMRGSLTPAPDNSAGTECLTEPDG